MEIVWLLSSPYIFAAVTATVLVSLCVWLGITYDRQQQNYTAGIKDEVRSNCTYLANYRFILAT